jgi:hypothetical protein
MRERTCTSQTLCEREHADNRSASETAVCFGETADSFRQKTTSQFVSV